MEKQSADAVRESARDHYGRIAGRISGGCCPDAATDEVAEYLRATGYSDDDLKTIPTMCGPSLGCGNPLATARIREGDTVLDLGSGAGLDSFFAAKSVGPTGRVIGVDMTPEMNQRAAASARSLGYANVEFRLGEIEHLPVADESVDVVISNCVVNLSPNKAQTFSEAYRVLKPSGRLSISDIVAREPLPAHVQNDLEAISMCIGGAATIGELGQMLRNAGFIEIAIQPKAVAEKVLAGCAGNTGIERFVVSATIEASKPKGETEDGFGQTASETNGVESKEYFDAVAGDWDTMRTHFFSDRVRQKAASVANIRPGMVAADIGAGTGFLTEELLARGARVIAIDPSENMLGQMRMKFGRSARVTYTLGDAEHIPLENDVVDAAFANMVLHHVENPAASVREMVRILKPGGTLAITDLDEHAYEFLRTEQHDRWLGFKRTDIERWLNEAGLAAVSVEGIDEECCSTSSCGSETARVSIIVGYGKKT